MQAAAPVEGPGPLNVDVVQGREMSGGHEGRYHSYLHGNVHVLALAGILPVPECGHGAGDGLAAGVKLGLGETDPYRRPILVARQVLGTAYGPTHHIRRFVVGVRPCLAKGAMEAMINLGSAG